MDGIKNGNRTIDGLKGKPLGIRRNQIRQSAVLPVDAIKKSQTSVVAPPVVTSFQISAAKSELSQKRPKVRQYGYRAYGDTHQKASLIFAAAVIFLAFIAGMWVEWGSSNTYAEKTPPVSEGGIVPLEGAVLTAAGNIDISNEMLFNTPLDRLQQYFASVSVPDVVAVRAEQLKTYLEKKGSPLAAQSAFIAEQEHWRLILAIAFAESTLGKRCYYYNCSGIGGSNIRTYGSTEEWITDFNRLLDKRYKDKTLEQMCGVYVQPCNPNWLLATKQVLGELQEAKIE